MTRPNINVTPLIDVLLVLLIIFMVVTPLRPAEFKAKVPSEERPIGEPIRSRLLSRSPPMDLSNSTQLRSICLNSAKSSRRSSSCESKTWSVRNYPLADPNFPLPDNIERTVFIKAPRSIGTVPLPV